MLRIELVRIAQKQRLTLWRTLYAIGLAAVIAAVYFTFAYGLPEKPKRDELVLGAQYLFFGLFGIQAALACALAPRLMADAIAAEKERQTLPFLLLTDLSSREIILDKLAARLAQLILFLLAGMPILVFLQLFGGIEALMILAGYAALFFTLLSLGCVSMLCSVYGRTTKASTQLFGRVIGLYIFMLIVGGNVLRAWPAIAQFPGSTVRPAVVNVGDIHELLNVGNPIAVVEHVIGGLRIGGGFTDVLWPEARNYCLFHLAVAAVCGTWAVRRLRPVAASQGDGPPLPSKRALLKPLLRPRVGNRPVFWKALYFDIRQSRTTAGRVFARAIFLLSFAPAIVPLVIVGVKDEFRGADMIMNVICRALVTVALCGMAVIIAGQASASIGRERNKRTLDELLLTDLTTDEILSQKWWGSMGVIRWGLVWVAFHWLLGVITGGLHVLAIPLLILEWVVYATFAASLGLYCAARMRTIQGSNGGTGLVGFAVVALPLIVGMVILMASNSQNPLRFLPIWMSPPAALGVTAFSVQNWKELPQHASVAVPAAWGASIGVVVCGLLAWQCWRGARWWFPRMVGRR